MASVILIEAGARSPVARRVRMRDRLRARLHGFALDEAIAAGVPPDSDPALTLRARELIGHRTRSELAVAMRRTMRGVDDPPSLARLSTPWRTVERASDLVDQLADRLLAPAPVEARGVAQARLLLSDASSPLFWSRRSAECRERVQRALAALEPLPT